MERIKVIEIFDSIEGEGSLIGYPVSFIRLEGCNLRCTWCDTKYSYDTTRYKELTINQILETIRKFGNQKVCLTGGEPILNKGFDTIFKTLLEKSYFVIIETNGTVYKPIIKNMWLKYSRNIHIVCSPKPFSNYMINEDLKPFIKEIKLIVDDFLTQKIIMQYLDYSIILQPEGNKEIYMKKALSLQKELLKRNIEVRIIPQIHKIFNLL